ncbi:hypothetical protein MNBD_GAMMA05-436 [hydrothermal vent metagenome]|uniref:AsmA domain-containing protein n=1 Tax=hydrothermal vent metagenome TaxID=652676 RepID=A0A3B0WMI9_9ZZZZ
MKIFKIVSIVVAVALVALLAFVATFDANNYKPEIIEQVEKATGRSFTIDGDINLSVFPWVGLKVEDVALGNEKGFSASNFAAIKQLDVKINVLPLLKKEVQINTIRLHGLNVSLEVTADKKNNWSSLTKADELAENNESKSTDEINENIDQSADVSSDESPLQSLKVEGFEFVDATIRYDDRSSQTTATVSALNLTTSAIAFDEEVEIDFGARIESNQPQIDTQLKLTTKLIFNQDFTEFNLRDFLFTIFAKANEFIAQDERIEIKSNIDVSMDKQRVVLKNLQISALGTNTVAEISISQFLETPLIQGGIEVASFNAREVAKRAGVELPAMAKANALNRVALKTKIKLRGEKFEANDFSFTLDENTMAGWLHVINISKQQIRYDLAFDQLNINHYMPPESVVSPVTENIGKKEGEISSKVVTEVTGNEKIELPIEMMRKLDIQGDFRIAALTAKEYEIKQLLMSLKAQQGVIAIKPLSMQVLEGQVDSAVTIDVQKTTPAYTINLNVNQVQVGSVANPYLKNVQGDKPLKMDGTVNVKMDVKTTGNSVNQLKQASKGLIVFDMKETRVDGFDPAFYVRKSVAEYADSIGFGLSKTIMGNYKPREVTVFDRIHSNVKLANGQARTNDFIMDSKRVVITAKGYADIVKNTLDMNTGMQLPRGKTAAEKIFNEPQYVRVHGPFDALEFNLDKKQLKKSTTGALKSEVKAKIDAEKKKLKAKVDAEKKRAKEKAKKELKKSTDKYKDKLKNKLKGLF